jgi:antitoxin YefM
VATETTYTKLRETLSSVLESVVNDQDIVIVRRKNGRDVALIPANELRSLQETANLMRSPKNAARLLKALRKIQKGGQKSTPVASAAATKLLREDANLEHSS